MNTRPSTGQPSLRGSTRRQFIKSAAAAWAGIQVLPRHVLGGAGKTSPNEKISLAGIGVGGVGFPQLQECEKTGFQITALCDVDDQYARKAYERWPKARRYRDFRELLQSEGDKIDAVHIATPDHTHALITLAALRKKKNVCCVKPLTRTIEECRLLAETAENLKLATQVTAAPYTSESACRTAELIWAGAIGPVRQVHVWSDRPLWPQGMMRPKEQHAVPAHLDWNLWIGPAPMRPYIERWPEGHYALRQTNMPGGGAPPYEAVYHPWNFRGWWDFGTGALGDMGCHYLNPVFRALKLDHPLSVQASATKVFEETAPLASIVTYEFPARHEMPPVQVIWYDGGLQPPWPREVSGRRLPDGGALYIGDEGMMLGHEILSAERARKFENVPKSLPRRGGTWPEWLEACRGGQPASCNFTWARLLTNAVLLGNIAIRTGKRLEWDPNQRRITNAAAANRYIHEPYHNGWSLDEGS